MDTKVIKIRTFLVFCTAFFIAMGCIFLVNKDQEKREKLKAAYAAETTVSKVEAQLNKYLTESELMEKLIEAYKKVNTGAVIELQTTDSTTGMTSAIDGSYDIGMASGELQDEEKDKLDSRVIATDGIAVIVNKNNTTDELSSDQVKTIYTGDATTWDEVVK